MSIRSSLRALLGSSKRRQAPKRPKPRTRLHLETVENRLVLSGFVPGSIQGQDGWSGGTTAISTSIDQTVDQTGSNAHSGVGALHMSNDTSNGNSNGAFSGWPFSPGLSVAAGQPSSGAGANQFSATFFFRSASTVADGSNIEVDLGTVAGDDRNTFLAITNRADADGGLQIRMSEPDGATGNFLDTQIVATNLDRATWHRIDIQVTFVDGAANDTFQVSLDGVPLTNPNLSSPNFGTPNFGTFEGYRDGIMSPYAQTNRLFFRSGAAPSNFGSFSDTDAQGFYIDDVSYKDWNSSAPSTTLASSAATFEPAGATVSTDYVNASWAGLAVGVDPDGAAGPATAIGYDAFATIQGGVDGVVSGGTVNVAAGTYVENVLVNKSVTLLGPNANVNPNTGVRGPEAIVVPATTDTAAGNVFAVTASDVTIKGFTIDGDNSSLTGGVVLNGVDVDAANGVSNADTFIDGLRVENNIIKNLYQNGVLGDLTAVGGTPSGDNFIVNNQIDNLPSISPVRGRGVLVADNFYAEISGNVLTRVATGIQTDNFFLANPGAVASIADNQIDYYARGIFHNLQYQSASTWTISGNDITADADATTTNGGLFIYSIQSDVGVVVTDNDVTGAHFGIAIWNDPTTSTVTVSGGTLTGNDIGILVTNNDLSFGAGAATTSVISGVTILDSVTAGIYVEGDSTAVNNNRITANGTGIQVTNGGGLTSVTENFITGNTGDGILITPTAGSVAPVFNNDLSGNGGLAVNNQSATTVNAVGNWWGSSAAAGVATEVSGNVDFMPFLVTSVDTSAAPGFQGDTSVAPGEGNVRVRVIGKRLMITGDNLDNLIKVEAGPIPNSYRVTGLYGTQINGRSGSFVFANVTRGLAANLMGGNDMFVLDGSASPFTVPGTIKVRTGSGADLVQLQGVTGKADLGSSSGRDSVQLIDSVFSALAVDMGNGVKTSLLLDDVTVTGRTDVRGGSGADTVRAVDSTLAALLIQTGLGSDTIRLENVHATGQVQVRTGRDTDLVAINDSSFAAAVVLDGRLGNDQLDAGTESNTNGNTFSDDPMISGFEDMLS